MGRIIVRWGSNSVDIQSREYGLDLHRSEGGPVRTLVTLLTYLLTPCNRVLLEKLTGSQLVKKFSAIYGTRRYITEVTIARHLSLS